MKNTYSLLEKMAKSSFTKLDNQIAEVQSMGNVNDIFISLKSKNGVAFCDEEKKWFYSSTTLFKVIGPLKVSPSSEMVYSPRGKVFSLVVILYCFS